MKKLALFSSMQIFIVIASAQNLFNNNRANLATDRHGDISYKSQKDYVMDNEFSIVITITGTTNDAGCNPSTASIDAALGSANASGDCGTPTLTTSDGPLGSSGCDRSQTRTWTATDACGDFVTGSRTVVWKVDVTPPGITATGTANNLGCNPSSGDIGAALGSAFASDACSPVSGTLADGAIQSIGCNRSQTRTWTATDACGNFTSVSRTVTWVESTSSPIGTVSGTNPNLGCNPSSAAIDDALGTATANPSCGPVQLTVSDGPIQSSGCDRSQTRTFTATDNCRSATAVRTATWTVDHVLPGITATGTTNNLGCNPSLADIHAALGSAIASDECSPPFLTVADGPIQSFGCVRSQTRIWTVADACGNSVSASRTVTWVDNVSVPVITVTGSDPNLGCNPTSAAIESALGTATVSANCGGQANQQDGPIISSGYNRSQTRTWTVTDVCGNFVSVSRTATWVVDIVTASIPDDFAANISSAIGSPNTIYVGFGGSSITLAANVTSSVTPNSFSYKWTIGSPAGPPIATGPTLTVSPTTTTTYFLSVKDQLDCSQQVKVSKQITVTDIRCGTDKVFMCELKNGVFKSVCIPSSKVTSEPAGSYLGQCAGTITRSGTDQKPGPTGELQIGSLSKLGMK